MCTDYILTHLFCGSHECLAGLRNICYIRPESSTDTRMHLIYCTTHIKGPVSRDWTGPCIVLMDRPLQAHVSRRFSDFLMASKFFNSNNCSRSVLAKNWRLCTQLAACKLYPSGRQSHANGNRVAASCMQHEKNQPKFACNWRPCGYNLHATGGHSGTICMPLAATRLQDKRQADKRCVKGRLYIIIIFF